MKLETGDEIVGRYLIEGRLGVGGMSTVMLATDQRLERRVAIKLLAEHLADDSTFVSRFRREALAAARLVHPNIVQVFDFGFDPESHQHFIVMEYVSGRSCAQILRDHGHLDVDETVDIVAQACNGLEYAHRHGVIHRDVKPGNLMVSETGVVKLADFGIARATGQSAITQVGSVLGTAAYLSPEQARGEEAGPYADLYALGVVAYQLLSGRLPYEAASLSELAMKQQRSQPIELDRLNPEVPPELADAIALAISVRPSERPQDAVALAAAVEDGARGIEPPRVTHSPRTDPETDATRVIEDYDEPIDATMIDQRRPPAARPQRSAGAQRPPQKRSRPPARRVDDFDDPYETPPRGVKHRDEPQRTHGLRRFFVLVCMLVVLVVIVIVAIGALSSNSSSVVHAKTLIVTDWQNGISQLKSMVDQYSQ